MPSHAATSAIGKRNSDIAAFVRTANTHSELGGITQTKYTICANVSISRHS
jgi:hypothetical protein